MTQRQYCPGCKDRYPLTERFFEKWRGAWSEYCIACRLYRDGVIQDRARNDRLQRQRAADGRSHSPLPGGSFLRIAEYSGRMQLYIGKQTYRELNEPDYLRPARRGDVRMLEVCGDGELGFTVIKSGTPHFNLGRATRILDLATGTYEAMVGRLRNVVTFGRMIDN